MLERFDTVKAWHDTLNRGRQKSRRGVRIHSQAGLNRSCQILKISPLKVFAKKAIRIVFTGEQLPKATKQKYAALYLQAVKKEISSES